MYSNSRAVKLLATVLSAMSLIVLTIEANAAFRRAHSSYCHYYNDTAGASLYNGAYLRNSTDSAVGIYCPAPSDGYLTHSTVTEVNVHGYEASGESNLSRACVKHYTNTGYACGTNKYWGSASSGVNGLDVSTWTANAYSFPYIYNSIDTDGRLYGYFIAN